MRVDFSLVTTVCLTGNQFNHHSKIKCMSNAYKTNPRVGISVCFVISILLFFTAFCDYKMVTEGGLGSAGSETTIKAVNGFNFITGTDLSPLSSMEGLFTNLFDTKVGASTQPEKVLADIWAILALAAAILGALVSFNKRGSRALPGTLLAVGGGIALFMLQSSVKKYESGINSNFLGIHTKMVFQPGYWICLAAFAITAIISLWPSPAKKIIPVVASMTTPIQIKIITQPKDTSHKGS